MTGSANVADVCIFHGNIFDNASILIFMLNYSPFCPLKYFENVFIEYYCLQVIDVAHGPLVFYML